MNRIIYITGANGFIGQNLVNYLSEKNYQIYVLLREKSIPKFILKKNIKIHYGDLLDAKSLNMSLPKGATIVNLAANPYHPKLSYAVNVQGVKNLLEIASFKKITKFIQISSLATKIKYKGNYAKSKNLGDNLVIKSGLNYIIIKPSMVYGSGEDGLFNKLKKIMSRKSIIPVFGDGNKKVYPLFINDLCFFIEKIISDQSLNSGTFDIGSTKAISFNNFYIKLLNIFNPKARLVHLPVWFGLIAAYFLRYLPNAPFNQDNILGSTQNIDCHSTTLIKRFNHKPIDFETGLKVVFKSEKINVVIVGFGKMGMMHSTILKTFPNVNIAGIVEKNKQIIGTIKGMLDIEVYSDLDEVFRKKKIDAVFICTPTFTHHDLIATALKNNVKILVEKPASLNLNDIKYLENAPNKKNIFVGYTLLFSRTFNTVKKIIDDKIYGEVLSFKGYCNQSEVLAPKQGWPYEKSKSGGGVLMNPGPHLFSLAYWYFGSPISQSSILHFVHSKEVEDKAEINLYYKKFKGELYFNWSLENQLISQIYLYIKLEKATILVDDYKIKIKIANKEKIILRRNIEPQISPIFNLNPESFGESYFTEDWFFIESISKQIKSKNDIKFAINTEKMILNSYQSK